MYFVVAWTTSVTPASSSGRNRYGVGIVLSTTRATPRSAHTFPIPATSETRNVGLASVSRRTALVFGRVAAATSAASEGTNETSIPYVANTLFKSANVPP